MNAKSAPLFLFLAGFAGTAPTALPDSLQPWEANPWYWSYDAEPVLLLGATDDDNLFQWEAAELLEQLDRLAAAGGQVPPPPRLARSRFGRHDEPSRCHSRDRYPAAPEMQAPPACAGRGNRRTARG